MLKHTIITLFTAVTIPITAWTQSVLSLSNSLTDNTIVLPESFETDTRLMMENWYLKNCTVLDSGIEFSQDIPTSDDVITDRLSKLPVEIEMPFNSVVRSIINTYTQRRRQLVQNLLGMSLYYEPIFEEALEREGMPMELKYLPVIESALNPNAVSRVGATGLWQFMAPTGKALGLEINSIVDERRDPVLSSQMAARYLKELYTIYGDWSLAIAAYNCGPGNVNKALRRAGDGPKDFWAIYPYLPSETRSYVPAFIAANYVMNYYNEHGIRPAVAQRPIITDSIHVKKRVYFQQISDVLNIPIDEIRILNPQYRKDYIPGDIKPYPLVLPSYQIYSYIMSEDSILAHDADKYARRLAVEPSSGTSTTREDGDYIITETTKYHTVKKGETFSSIAKKYGVTVNSIKRANNIKSLKRGRKIKIIVTERTLKPREPELPETDNTMPSDNLNLNIDTDSITVADSDSIAGDNNLTADTNIQPSTDNVADTNPQQQAREKTVNQPAQTNKPTGTTPVYHTVKKGESVYKISLRYNTTVNKILKLNSMSAKDKIHPGQKLRVK